MGNIENIVNLFAKYRNAKMLPRARSAKPKVNFSIPESSPTSPSCLRCLKYNDMIHPALPIRRLLRNRHVKQTMLIKSNQNQSQVVNLLVFANLKIPNHSPGGLFNDSMA